MLDRTSLVYEQGDLEIVLNPDSLYLLSHL